MTLKPINQMFVFTQPLCNWQDVAQGQFLNGIKLVWIQFSFLIASLTKGKEPNLFYYLFIAC